MITVVEFVLGSEKVITLVCGRDRVQFSALMRQMHAQRRRFFDGADHVNGPIKGFHARPHVDVYDSQLARYLVITADCGKLVASARLLSLGTHTPLSDQASAACAFGFHHHGMFLDQAFVADGFWSNGDGFSADQLLIAAIIDLCLVEKSPYLVVDRHRCQHELATGILDVSPLATDPADDPEDVAVARFVSQAVSPHWASSVRRRVAMPGLADPSNFEEKMDLALRLSIGDKHAPFEAEVAYTALKVGAQKPNGECELIALFDAVEQQDKHACKEHLIRLMSEKTSGETGED